jgi:HSP20 family protein
MMLDRRLLAPEIEEVQRRMEETWRRLSGFGTGHAHYCSPVYEPPTDVFETADDILVSMEIAGISGQQVEVQAEGERVTIRGNRLDRRQPQGNGRRILQLEVAFGAFARTLYLPATIDASEATARYIDGFLEIRLPKLPIRRQYLVRIAVD